MKYYHSILKVEICEIVFSLPKSHCGCHSSIKNKLTNYNFKEDEITATSSKISDITPEEMEKKCVIFKCENLSNYQKAVNDAAIELAKKDGSFLLNKGKLFEMAREKVFADGYPLCEKRVTIKIFWCCV